MRLKAFALAIAAALLVATHIALAATQARGAPGTIDFAAPAAIIELKDQLVPYRAFSGAEVPDSRWYMLTAANSSVRPATRVFLAAQPPDAEFRFWPLSARPYVQQVAASDSQVIVEDARAHGRHAFRVTIPPATSVTLAIRIAYGDAFPSVLAWTEPALVSYNRQLAVLLAAVAGTIAAAMAITLGLAVMTGHPAPVWASVLLVLVFAVRLAVTGTLDAGWATHIGGPYGLEIALAGLAFAVGLRLSDIVVPIETLRPSLRRFVDGVVAGVTGLALLCFLGIPGAMALTGIAIVLGTVALAIYFAVCGWRRSQAARVAAPSVAVFALVTLFAAALSFVGLPDNQAAPALVGGFTAAGAVLLALAVAAGEGIAVLPASRYGTNPVWRISAASARSGPLTASQSAAAQAIGASHQGVFDLDFGSEELTLSPETAALIGLAVAPVTTTHEAWIARVHPEDRDTYREAMSGYRGRPGIAFRLEFRARSESGRYPWFELRATMKGDKSSEAERCLGLLANITPRKEAEAVLAERNFHDPLTGLGNRIVLMDRLDRLGGDLASITVALLDIDRFKSVHASLGGSGADAVLAALALRLAGRFRDSAEIFRAGGDTFALMFFRQEAEPAAIGADLVNVFSQPFESNERRVFVTASVGIAAGRDACDPFDLLKNAELALLQAKRRGGARASVYTKAFDTLAPEDAVALEADLRQALQEEQLDVYYQPIVRLSDGSIAGFEALLRWKHPTKGLIEPSGFVAHCEETGLIVAIGRLALERAAQDLCEWQRFFPLDPPLFASVNLSRRQLLDGDIESVLNYVLRTNRLKPGSLKLEVTESAVAGAGDAREVLERLRAAGASLAIDDFGTGLSNFQQLKDLPFDTIKLDRSFLDRESATGGEANGSAILSSLVSLAHELERDVVMEGVETGQEAEWLRNLGCEFGQGFYFSAPLPRDKAREFIARHYDANARQA